MKNRITKLVMKICIVLITLTSANLYAATKTWNGSISTDWNTAGNWSSSGVPGSSDDAIIPTSPTGGRWPNMSTGTVTLNTLTVNSGATLTIAGGNITTNNDGKLYGTINISSGSYSEASGKKLEIIGGVINQSGGTVTISSILFSSGATYNQSGGTLTVNQDLRIPTGCTFNSTGGTVIFNTGTTAIDFTGNVQFFNVQIAASGNLSITNGMNYKVAGNFTNYNANLDIEQGTITFNGTTPQTIYSASTASNETLAANIIFSSTSNVTLLSNVGASSDITVQTGGTVILNGNNLYESGGTYNGPLPVELVSFNANFKSSTVQLSWQTATEVNNYGFEVERSLTPTPSQREGTLTWEKIGFVAGHGNSNSPKEYFFEDSRLSNNSYHYRLKQVDSDGSFAYSNSVSVSLNQVPGNFALYQNYPNPFNPTTIIRYAIAEESFVTIKVYNIIGSEIATLVNEKLSAGSFEINFDASSLSSGAYIYKIQAGRFSETRKMILSK